jgi:hypothetical protein
MTVTDGVVPNGKIHIIFNAIGPFNFRWTANINCFVTDSAGTKHQLSSSIATGSLTDNEIRLANDQGTPKDIVSGILKIEIYGIDVKTSPAADYISFKVITYSDASATQKVDESIIESSGFNFKSHPSGSALENKLEIKKFVF